MTPDPLQSLRDPDPPYPDPGTLGRIRHRAKAISRRRRWIRATAASITVVCAGAGFLIVGDATTQTVDTAGQSTTTGTASSQSTTRDGTTSPGDAVALCFPAPIASTAPLTGDSPVPIADWPGDAAPLLVLAGNGELWVLADGQATPWTTDVTEGRAAPGYRWARWDIDGSILATRLVDAPQVILERLTAPRRSSVAATLGFTVNQDAPDGYCPIDGYLTTFAAGPDGVFLVHHQSGPIPHSCPVQPTTATTDPWRCQSPEGISFERRQGELSGPGTPSGTFIGGSARIVADSSETSTYAISQDQTVTVIRPGQEPECCLGGQRGTAFSLSPDGNALAYTPDGTTLVVSNVTEPAAAEEIWRAPDEITATAFSDDWIAVAHGNTLSLVSRAGTEHSLTNIDLYGITSLDWQP